MWNIFEKEKQELSIKIYRVLGLIEHSRMEEEVEIH